MIRSRGGWPMLAVVIGALLAVSAGAQVVSIDPLARNEFLRDELDLFDDETRGRIRELHETFLADLDARLVVLTIESTTTYADQPLPLEYFAALLHKAWFSGESAPETPGEAKSILLLISRQEGRVYFEVGRHWGRKGFLEGINIVNERMRTHFAESRYSEGVLAGLGAMEDYLRDWRPPRQATIPWWGIAKALLFTSGTVIILLWAWRRFTRDASLHELVRSGDFEGVARLLNRGSVGINSRDDYGASPLYYAAVDGYVEITRLLLDQGAEANTEKTQGDTPLFQAAKSGRLEIVKLLVARRANINARNRDGITPLMAAARAGHGEVVRKLVLHGARVDSEDNWGNTCLHMSIQSTDDTVVDFLLEQGADPNRESSDCKTPLLLAVELNLPFVVELLVNHDADVNAGSSKGVRPLMMAIQHGSQMIAEILLEAGADPRGEMVVPDDLGSSNDFGRNAPRELSPREYAAFRREEKLALLLEQYEEKRMKSMSIHSAVLERRLTEVEHIIRDDPHSVNERSVDSFWTPLLLAIRSQDKAMVELLLARGANPDAATKKGLTPLMYSVLRSTTGVTENLLEVGADPLPKISGWRLPQKEPKIEALDTNEELDAEEIARRKGEAETTGLLKKYKADCAAYLNLQGAVFRGDLKSAEEIIHLNPSCVNFRKNDAAWPPLLRAARDGDEDMVRFLLDKNADPNLMSKEGKTPIHYASVLFNTAILELLLDHDADPDTRCKGKTPLFGAVQVGNYNPVEVLLRRGADADAKNEEGLAAVHFAAMRGDDAVVKLLIDFHCDVNERCNGRTPLDSAAVMGNESTVRLLLDFGADVNGRNEDGKTSVHHAAGKGAVGVLKVLVAKGADVNIAYRGELPLDRALKTNQHEAAEFLRGHGAVTSDQDVPSPVKSAT